MKIPRRLRKFGWKRRSDSRMNWSAEASVFGNGGMKMSRDREERALEALIVSQLRACDETNVEHLPKLTDDERKSLDSLGSDFVQRLLSGVIKMSSDSSEGRIHVIDRTKALHELS